GPAHRDTARGDPAARATTRDGGVLARRGSGRARSAGARGAQGPSPEELTAHGDIIDAGPLDMTRRGRAMATRRRAERGRAVVRTRKATRAEVAPKRAVRRVREQTARLDVRLAVSAVARIEALRPRYSRPWRAATRADVLRVLLLRGLEVV